MTDCIFCKIIKGEIPSQVVYEDENVFAFKDIQPQAPVHVLVIPKKHFSTLNDVDENSMGLIANIFQAVRTLSQQMGIAEKGYRCVFNTEKEGGQAVYHLHLHLLAGKQLGPSLVG